MDFGMFTVLYNYHYCLSLEYLSPPQKELCPISSLTSSPPALGTITLLSVSLGLPIVDISYDCNQVIYLL